MGEQELPHVELLIFTCQHSVTTYPPQCRFTTYRFVPHMCDACIDWVLKRKKGWGDNELWYKPS